MNTGIIKKIDHIAVAVRDIDDAIRVFRDQLGLSMTKTYHSEYTRAHIAFFRVGETHVELIQPTSLSSVMAKFLDKRGEGIHHVCLGVKNIDEVLASLAAKGMELIDEKPRMTQDGRKIAFVNPRSTHGVLIELAEIEEQGTE